MTTKTTRPANRTASTGQKKKPLMNTPAHQKDRDRKRLVRAVSKATAPTPTSTKPKRVSTGSKTPIADARAEAKRKAGKTKQPKKIRVEADPATIVRLSVSPPGDVGYTITMRLDKVAQFKESNPTARQV